MPDVHQTIPQFHDLCRALVLLFLEPVLLTQELLALALEIFDLFLNGLARLVHVVIFLADDHEAMMRGDFLDIVDLFGFFP